MSKKDFWDGYVPEPDKRQQALDRMAENARELGLDYEPAQQEPVARQYQNRDGVWKDFISEKHYKDTLEDGSWPIRNLYTSPPAQQEPVVWHDAPQTIYLQVCPEADHCEVRFADHDEVTWCQDKIHDSDIAYVRASTTQQPPAQQQSCYCPNCEALSKELAELKAQQEPFGYFKAEPFGWTDCAETDEGAVALYQHPPAQRTWVGLTDQEIENLWNQHEPRFDYYSFSCDIEAKLKEKNT